MLSRHRRHLHLEMTNCFACNFCNPWQCSSKQNLVSKPTDREPLLKASQLISGVPRLLTYKTLLFYYLNCGEFATERLTVHRGIRIWPHRIHTYTWTPTMLMEVVIVFLTSSGQTLEWDCIVPAGGPFMNRLATYL